MQPCGLRDLARPWGRRSFDLKARRVAGCARGSLAQKALKNNHATLRAAGFGTPSGATFVWPQSRTICGLSPRHLGRKGAKKTFMQPCGLRDLARPRRRQSFGLKTGRVAGCVRGTLGPKGLKKHSCNPVGCEIWRALGGDGRLASRPGELRAASAVPLAQRV